MAKKFLDFAAGRIFLFPLYNQNKLWYTISAQLCPSLARTAEDAPLGETPVPCSGPAENIVKRCISCCLKKKPKL